ncbi:hypothetical protein AVEN_128771-1 [Araneus ventricosus]|uniref:Uncharacterized protein n=1 Tax=Araneus ventricosus TaxID=182803 RepID=A0A4Y2Q8M4_ARAVE|nr:hypothetical protein AVEN_227941-1 [Araneus ventricosus]GBN59814.1 hypothetical protein AVEN_128771-1 [Araneus ventricosus]
MGLSLHFSIDSTLPKPLSVLVGKLAHQSIMLRFASSQPPTIWHHPANNIANMVPKSGQQFNVKKKIHNLLQFLQRETSLFRPDPN